MTRIPSSATACLAAILTASSPGAARADGAPGRADGWSIGLWGDPLAGDRLEGRDGGAAGAEEPYELAQADCSAAAAQAAAQTGGQVLSVSSRNEGGQVVCVVTVLIPGQGGERPRKTTITIRP